MQLLLQAEGIDINKASKFEKKTALIAASSNGHTEVVQMLLRDEGVDVNQANIYKDTPLYLAVNNGHTIIVKMLLQSPEIDLNKEYKNETVLWIASGKGFTEIVQHLLVHPRTNITKGVYEDEDIILKVANLISNEEAAFEIETQDILVLFEIQHIVH